ncbi:Retrotransposon-derived protein PEG10 [Smittium mucronatum]|uniref:Retrotransposon-derived protein PEG10 n=1 Tax=Smittium mucronatum TaxID=133383 RepID=A0A1R0H407_9FUNG|nr:Retrotransposon-derived protein PEG10 [Smittium mucronatum]
MSRENPKRTPTPRPFYSTAGTSKPTMTPVYQEPATESGTTPVNEPRSEPVPNTQQTPLVVATSTLIPESTLKLPDAVRFDGSPTICQVFMSSMSLRLLRKLTQVPRSVSKYAAEFRSIARDCGFDQLALVVQFIRGLDDKAMKFMIMVDLTNDLEGNFAISILIDNRITSRSIFHQENSSNFPRQPPRSYPANSYVPTAAQTGTGKSESIPMEIDAITSKFRAPLTHQEKKRRRELGLCLYCGRPGHLSENCPLKSISNKSQIPVDKDYESDSEDNSNSPESLESDPEEIFDTIPETSSPHPEDNAPQMPTIPNIDVLEDQDIIP